MKEIIKKTVTLEEVVFYLQKMGWVQADSNKEGLIVYYEPTVDNPFEIILPKSGGKSDEALYVSNAISIIANYEDKFINEIIESVKRVDNDLFNYRIEKVYHSSISITLLSEFIQANKYLLREAARLEHSFVYNKLTSSEKKENRSPTEESKEYLQQCRFAHTWEGSFGITIETPLWLPSLGLFNEIKDTLGRKVTKRIIKGYNIINEAVKIKSIDYIFNNSNNENDILIFEKFASLQEVLRGNKINIEVVYSPTISIDEEFNRISNSEINENTLKFISRAVEQINKPDDEIDINIIGFPKTIHARKEDLLAESEENERRVVVEGVSDKFKGTLSLTMTLTLDDYKKSIQAQDKIKSVSVKCRIKKGLKGYDVLKVYSFSLID